MVDKQQILKLNKKGYNASYIARTMGCNPCTIERFLNKHGLPTNPTKLSVTIDWATIHLIVNNYAYGHTARQILKELNLPYTENTIIKIVKMYGKTPIRARGHQAARLENEYFDLIDSPSKAYLLGWVMTDGYIVNYKGHNHFGIELQASDIEILQLFKHELKYQGRIYYRQRDDTYYLNIYSKHLCESLMAHGVTYRKSKTLRLNINNISPELQRDYIRGLFDGDGCVHTNGVMTYYSASASAMSEMASRVEKVTGKRYTVTDNRQGCFSLSISSKANIKKIVECLYYPKCLCLSRKLNRIIHANTVLTSLQKDEVA